MVLLTSRKRVVSTSAKAAVVDCPGRPAYMDDNFSSRRRATFTVSDPRRRATPTHKSPGRHWVPAPGRARRAADVARDRGRSFPLCLVCDANGGGGDDVDVDARAEALARRCEAEAGAEADDAATQRYFDRRRAERQRMKTMRSLWEMGGGDERLKRWHDILMESAEHDRKQREAADKYQRDRAELWVHERPETTFRPIKGRSQLVSRTDAKRRSGRRKTVKLKEKPKGDAKSKAAQEEDPEKISKADGNDKPDAVLEKGTNMNLTESLVEDREKVAPKEGIGRKQTRRRRRAERRRRDDKEEELRECLRLIERAKDKLLDDGRGDDASNRSNNNSSNGSTDVSVTLSSSKERHKQKSKKAKEKDGSKGDEDDDDDGGDYFAEVIIDELKGENAELRAGIDARDRQLKGAADKIREMVEENAGLARRLEKALAAAHEHAENIGEKIRMDEEESAKIIAKLKSRVADLEARESLARANASSEAAEATAAIAARLREAERRNRELQDYVDHIKASYAAAFGN